MNLLFIFFQGLPSPYKNPLLFSAPLHAWAVCGLKAAAKRFSGVGDGSLPLWGLVRKLRLQESVSVKIVAK